MFKPRTPFCTEMKLLIPTHTMVKGSPKTTYSKPEDSESIFGSFYSYGGTEAVSNGILTIINTAIVETWYKKEITSDCRLYVCKTGEQYKIIGRPENIDMRNQYLKIRVEEVGGAI